MRPERSRPTRPAIRTALHAGSALLALGVAACALDRSGSTSEGVSAASSSSGEAQASTTGGTTPSGSSAETATTDASASSGGNDAGGGGSAETASSGGDGGDGGDGGGATGSSSSDASSGSGGAGPLCGDDEPEGSEECDDGNETAGDGCGPTCLIEEPDDCFGTPIPLEPAGLEIRASTVGANDTFQESQDVGFCDDGEFDGPDLVYAVTPSITGTLRAELIAQYDAHSLVIRTTCGMADDDFLHCDYGEDSDDVDRVDAQVQQGATYYVVVDSYDGEAGEFTLDLQLTN